MDGTSSSSWESASHTGEKTRSRRVERWIALAIALVLLAGVCLLALPREVGRWFRAAADEARLDGDLDGARLHLDRALGWSANDPDLLMARSRILLRLKRFEESLQDCERATELADGEAVEVLLQRLLIHQRMGQHDLALEDADQIVEMLSERYTVARAVTAAAYADALNTRAYAHALSNQGVEDGLADIQQTFTLLGTEDNAAYLDTRGYLYYLAGDIDNAQRDMERSVKLAEDDRSALLMGRETMLRNGVDPRQIDLRDESVEHSLAVLYHHRGLVNEALGRDEDASRDFKLADALGYSPEDGVW